MEQLDAQALEWRSLSDADLSKRLIALGIRTATGLRFQPERVRDFRRSVDRAEAAETAAQARRTESVVMRMRTSLARIISELDGSVSVARLVEIDAELEWIGLTLLEDRWRSQQDGELIRKAWFVAERKRGR